MPETTETQRALRTIKDHIRAEIKTATKRTGRYSVIPEGDIIVWKKVMSDCRIWASVNHPKNHLGVGKDLVAKLLIPADAKRHGPHLSGDVYKCRASKAIVLGIESLNGKKQFTHAFAMSQKAVQNPKKPFYQLGKTIRIRNWRLLQGQACAPGIHFFLTRTEAACYKF